MKKLKSTHKGFSIIEIVISSAIFILFTLGLLSAFIIFNKSYIIFGDENRAIFVAEEGIEAVKNIFESDFDNLIDGTHGLSYSGGEWVFSGSADVQGIYTREIIISSVDSETKKIISNVSWQRANLKDGDVSLTIYLSNYNKEVFEGDCLELIINTACFESNGRTLSNLMLSNACDSSFTIENMTFDWNRTDANIRELTIDGVDRWKRNCNWNCSPTGDQISGTLLDFGDNDLVISANSTINFDAIAWDKDMESYDIGPIIAGLSSGDTVNFSQFSPFVCGTSLPDTTAPENITDLNIYNVTETSLNLDWTAPGDDLNIGLATEYDIRHAFSPITDLNWDSATQVLGEPVPLPAGNNQSLLVENLAPGTTYYFAMKTSDEVPNISGLSNVVSTSTIAVLNPQADDLSVNIDNISLSPNNKEISGIILENIGSSDIIISQIILNWTGGQNGSNLNDIEIDSINVWSGNASSGQVLDITDTVFTPGQISNLNKIVFSKKMNGSNIEIIFKMIDGSEKIVNFSI